MTNTNSKSEPVAICVACGKDLPDFKPRLHVIPTCDNKECRRIAYNTPARKNLTIKEGEILCALEGCSRPVPAGEYDISKTLFFCCPACRAKYKPGAHSTRGPRRSPLRARRVRPSCPGGRVRRQQDVVLLWRKLPKQALRSQKGRAHHPAAEEADGQGRRGLLRP